MNMHTAVAGQRFLYSIHHLRIGSSFILDTWFYMLSKTYELLRDNLGMYGPDQGCRLHCWGILSKTKISK